MKWPYLYGASKTGKSTLGEIIEEMKSLIVILACRDLATFQRRYSGGEVMTEELDVSERLWRFMGGPRKGLVWRLLASRLVCWTCRAYQRVLLHVQHINRPTFLCIWPHIPIFYLLIPVPKCAVAIPIEPLTAIMVIPQPPLDTPPYPAYAVLQHLEPLIEALDLFSKLRGLASEALLAIGHI